MVVIGPKQKLSSIFLEEALFKYRVQVEIEYFIALTELGLPQFEGFNTSLYEDLRSLYLHFGQEDASAIKEIEKTTNHDVKAVEYFIKKNLMHLDSRDTKNSFILA